jgi:antitoxin component of MazEF toxin-antitoxin module
MIKTLTKHGNSWALIIDKPVLELLKITHDTPLEISTDGRSLTIVPANLKSREAKFEAALDKTNKNYGQTLKKLAE